jgi:hypothetical protein
MKQLNNIFGHQSGLQANGQAINRGNVLSGLTRESAFTPKTGTATGNQAASDFAKSARMGLQADVGRGIDKKNAESQWLKQQQKEQLTQQGRALRMGRFQQSTQQQISQMDLATRLRQAQIEMATQWQTGLIGMMR